jgi:hypothetical protein
MFLGNLERETLKNIVSFWNRKLHGVKSGMVDVLFPYHSICYFLAKKMFYQSVLRAAAQHVANSTYMRFGIFTAVRICIMISWVTILQSLVGRYYYYHSYYYYYYYPTTFPSILTRQGLH